MANNERKRPIHVAREIFGIEGWSVIRENGAPILFVAMDFHQDAPKVRFGFKRNQRRVSATLESPAANRLSPYCAVTSVPTGIAENKLCGAPVTCLGGNIQCRHLVPARPPVSVGSCFEQSAQIVILPKAGSQH